MHLRWPGSGITAWQGSAARCVALAFAAATCSSLHPIPPKQVCTGVMLHGYPLVKTLCGGLQVGGQGGQSLRLSLLLVTCLPPRAA